MEREEAINLLGWLKSKTNRDDDLEAIDMAIEALQAEPTHGRLIDADALKKKAQERATEAWKMNLTARIETVLNQFIDWINDAPTVQADRPHGEWIIRDESYWRKHHSGDIQVNKVVLVCSECGHRLIKPWKIRNFCPNCGCVMDMRGGGADGKTKNTV